MQRIIAADKHFTALVFPDIKRDKVRFLFSYNNNLKAVAYMVIGNDGSLYLNPRLPTSEKFYKNKGIADGLGGFSTIGEDEIKDSSDIKKSEQKVSYHSSGRVKGFGDFEQSINLRTITERTLIQANQFTKPERYKTIEEPNLRTTDIIVPSWDGKVFELDSTKPLMCRVFVEPLKDASTQLDILERPNNPAQSALVFPATGLVDREGEPIQDLIYHLHFFNEELGNGPDYTFTSFQRVKSI
jgi:hypothetical protein